MLGPESQVQTEGTLRTKKGPESHDPNEPGNWGHQQNSDNNGSVVCPLVSVIFNAASFGLSVSVRCVAVRLRHGRRPLRALLTFCPVRSIWVRRATTDAKLNGKDKHCFGLRAQLCRLQQAP